MFHHKLRMLLLTIWGIYNVCFNNNNKTMCIFDPKQSMTIYRGSYNMEKCCVHNLCCRNSTIKNIYNHKTNEYLISLVQIC